ncbi:MAG: hypothetical protein AAGJ40_09000 [Planctomycetota bacterium]
MNSALAGRGPTLNKMAKLRQVTSIFFNGMVSSNKSKKEKLRWKRPKHSRDRIAEQPNGSLWQQRVRRFAYELLRNHNIGQLDFTDARETT